MKTRRIFICVRFQLIAQLTELIRWTQQALRLSVKLTTFTTYPTAFVDRIRRSDSMITNVGALYYDD